MITIQTIQDESNHLYNLDSSYTSVQKFNPGGKAFETSSSEEVIWLLKGNKKDFKNLSHFWLQSLELTNGICDSPSCQILSEEEIEQKLSNQRNKLQELVTLNGSVVQGYIMVSEWNDWILIIEEKESYIFIEWLTTA